jgi:predicted DNA-binding protein (UPF0251 family)
MPQGVPFRRGDHKAFELTIREAEALRLADLPGKLAAKRMGLALGTYKHLLRTAREKAATLKAEAKP